MTSGPSAVGQGGSQEWMDGSMSCADSNKVKYSLFKIINISWNWNNVFLEVILALWTEFWVEYEFAASLIGDSRSHMQFNAVVKLASRKTVNTFW